jgi:signal transduction histidine kinase
MTNRQLRLLILETLPNNTTLLIRELKKIKINFTLSQVKSKKQIFNEIKNNRPDAIFLNTYIPDVKGLEEVNFIKHRYPSIPLIYLLKSADGNKFKYLNGDVIQHHRNNFSSQIAMILKNIQKKKQKNLIQDHKEIVFNQYEEQCHTLPTKETEGTWCFEFDHPISLNLSEEEQFNLIKRSAYLAECNDNYIKKFSPCQPNEIIGTPLNKLFDFTDKNTKEYFTAIIHAKYNLQDYESIEIDQKGNNRIYINNHLGINDNGHIIGIWGMQRDITQQKQLEEQLSHSKKRQPLGNLVGGIAHDFNNILTVINGYAENALMDVQPKSPLHYDMSIILEAGRRAKNLTHQLLAYCRNQIIERKIININEMILNLENMFDRMINHDIIIEKKLFTGIASIKADPVQIEQILINLMINARDAINQKIDPRFKKKIIIETKNIYLNKEDVNEHPELQEGQYILISISDNGIGMDNETKKHIFRPFFSTKNKDKGIGIGLTTVYNIVTQNEGSILVNSEKDEGSTFNIYLPCIKNRSMTTSFSIHDPKNKNFQNHFEIVI